MSRAMASEVRGAMTRTAVAVALIGIVATGATVRRTQHPASPGCPVSSLLSTIAILVLPPTRMIPDARRCLC